MANGVNYVRNPEYDGVSGYSVASEDIIISSGSTIVEGIYYIWDAESGFTNISWFTDIEGSPLQKYFADGMYSYDGINDYEQLANNYIQNFGNLNAVFEYWSKHYTLADWNNFYTAVGVTSGCMDVVRQ